MDGHSWKKGGASMIGQREKSMWDAGLNNSLSQPHRGLDLKWPLRPATWHWYSRTFIFPPFISYLRWTTLGRALGLSLSMWFSEAEVITEGLTAGGFLLPAFSQLGNKSFLERRSKELCPRVLYIL